jgi:DNA-directed RNA polymerase specialized sigma subunit
MLDYLREIDPSPRSARRFQKLRDAVIDALLVAGKVPSHEEVAKALGVSPCKYAMLCRMIAAVEPMSIHDFADRQRNDRLEPVLPK